MHKTKDYKSVQMKFQDIPLFLTSAALPLLVVWFFESLHEEK